MLQQINLKRSLEPELPWSVAKVAIASYWCAQQKGARLSARWGTRRWNKVKLKGQWQEPGATLKGNNLYATIAM